MNSSFFDPNASVVSVCSVSLSLSYNAAPASRRRLADGLPRPPPKTMRVKAQQIIKHGPTKGGVASLTPLTCLAALMLHFMVLCYTRIIAELSFCSTWILAQLANAGAFWQLPGPPALPQSPRIRK